MTAGLCLFLFVLLWFVVLVCWLTFAYLDNEYDERIPGCILIASIALGAYISLICYASVPK